MGTFFFFFFGVEDLFLNLYIKVSQIILCPWVGKQPEFVQNVHGSISKNLPWEIEEKEIFDIDNLECFFDRNIEIN